MLRVTGFIAREPSDGAKPTQDTNVYLANDHKNLYAAFVCWDSEPEKIRARMDRREDILSDDSVEVMIDTFHDARRGYAFAVNPFGIQWDALWTEGTSAGGQPADYGGFDVSFDTVWNSEGHLTSRGYVVLMSIPFKSLRFPSSRQQSWGIILNRSIPRTNENLFWPRISNRIQGRFNQAATLEGLEDISPSRNMQFNPYGAFRSFRDIDQRDPARPFFEGRAFKPDVGLDSKFILRDSFVVDTTVNPDFSQVESDQPQITVNQRFEVFFPEKRPFFLENSNYFMTPINLVFTRRIGHPGYGLRLTGKSGPWSIGAFFADDKSPGDSVAPADPLSGAKAYFGVLRVNHDIGKQSTLGLIYTDRELATVPNTACTDNRCIVGSNRVGGIDAKITFSPTWYATAQALVSSTDFNNGFHKGGPDFWEYVEHST